MKDNTQPLKIYRDGQLSRYETYAPVIKRAIVNYLNKVDYWIATSGQWPSETER